MKRKSKKKKSQAAAPVKKVDQQPGSVSSILREYWDTQEAEEQVRIYQPGTLKAAEPAPAAEDTIRVYSAKGQYTDRPDYSIRDILSQFWRDNPQAMVDMVRLPEPKAETREEEEIYYTVREILSQFWKDNPQAMVDMVPLPEPAESVEPAETVASAEEPAAIGETAGVEAAEPIEAAEPAGVAAEIQTVADEAAAAPVADDVEALTEPAETEAVDEVAGETPAEEAAEATEAAAEINEEAAVESAEAEAAGAVEVTVEDEDEGISPELQAAIDGLAAAMAAPAPAAEAAAEAEAAITEEDPSFDGEPEAAAVKAPALDDSETELSFDLKEILWEYWHRAQAEAVEAEQQQAAREAEEARRAALAQARAAREAEAAAIAQAVEQEAEEAARLAEEAAVPKYVRAEDLPPVSEAGPVEEPDAVQESGGYAYKEAEDLSALDILREYWTSGETSELEDIVEKVRASSTPGGGDDPRSQQANPEEDLSVSEAAPEPEQLPLPEAERPESGENSPEAAETPVTEEPPEAELQPDDPALPPEADSPARRAAAPAAADFDLTKVFALGSLDAVADGAPSGLEHNIFAEDTPAVDDASPAAQPADFESEVEEKEADSSAPFAILDAPRDGAFAAEKGKSGSDFNVFAVPDGDGGSNLPKASSDTTLSVDDILAEYHMLYREDTGATDREAHDFKEEYFEAGAASIEAASPAPAVSPLGTAASAATGAAAAAAVTAATAVGTAGKAFRSPPEKEDDKRGSGAFAAPRGEGGSGTRKAASEVSAMADEARRYIASLTEEDYQNLKDEIDYDRPRRSTVTPAVHSPKRDDFDDLFNLSGKQEKMVFGDVELDLSPDEDYVPPKAPEDSVFHWTAGEEDLPEAPQEAPGLLQRIMNFNGATRKARPKPRPLNAPGPRPIEDAPDSADQPFAQGSPAETGTGVEVDPRDSWDSVFSATAQGSEESEQSAEPISSDASDIYTPEQYQAAAAEFLAAQMAGGSAQPTPDAGETAAPSVNTFTDREAAPAGYAPERDYAPSWPEENDGSDLPGSDDFPSFGQYLLGLVSGILIRLRGYGGGNAAGATMEDDEELGREVSTTVASKYYGAFVRSLRLRFRIALVLLVVLAWISLGLPVTGMLKTIRVAAAFCLAIQLTVMLLSLDVVTNAAVNLTRGRFGADSLASLACVLTSFDALAVALDGFGSPHMPLCLLSSLALTGVLASSLLSTRSLRKATRVPAIGKHCYAVTAEPGVKGKGLTLLKTAKPAAGFVRRSEEAAPDETAWHRAAPALLLLSLLLTVIVAIARHSGGDFLYILTAFLAPAVPVTALLAFALPYFVGTMRIFSSGAALAGWSGIVDVGQSQNLVVTDRDLFPEGSVEIESIRIFADADAEKIISYAGTMITASGMGTAHCFAELMERNGGSIRRAENFEYLPGGGMQANIGGQTVLCGSTDLMRLMNVRVPFRLVGKTSVLLAIDGVLYGIFNMKYTGLPQVRKALVGLIRSNRHPIFAVRDFNVNPEMLHGIFDLATDGYDFPPYVERFAISEAKPGEESKISAVVCREGLGPLVHMADTGRSVYVAARINLLLTLLTAVIGVFVVLVRFLGAGSVGVGFLLLYVLLWALPVALVSLFLRF